MHRVQQMRVVFHMPSLQQIGSRVVGRPTAADGSRRQQKISAPLEEIDEEANEVPGKTNGPEKKIEYDAIDGQGVGGGGV
jgi:hypothetical protein